MVEAAPITSTEITRLLSQWGEGDERAQERLLRLIYPRLRAIAAGRLPGDGRPLTLQTSDLVQEAYLKLIGQRKADWKNRAHFFAIAARLMRRIVIDHARRRSRHLRLDQERQALAPEGARAISPEEAAHWLEVDRAIEELAAIDARAAKIVELRYFAGMKTAEVAEVLQASRSTVVRDWRFARAWLKQRLGEEGAS